jgi:hypothetical protein
MAAKRPRKAPLAAADESSNGHGPASEVPIPPSDLAPAGLAVWAEVWALPHVAIGDRFAIERLARLEDEAAKLREVLARDGMTLERPIQSATGAIIGKEVSPHAALQPLRKIGAEAAALCNTLGLTPAGRQALGLDVVDEEPEPDELDLLIEKHNLRRLRELNGDPGSAT